MFKPFTPFTLCQLPVCHPERSEDELLRTLSEKSREHPLTHKNVPTFFKNAAAFQPKRPDVFRKPGEGGEGFMNDIYCIIKQ